MDTLNGYTFDIDFNECDLNKFNINKKIKPLINKFKKFKNDNYDENIKNYIINKIKCKIEMELIDEKDIIFIYNAKIIKLINKLKEEKSNDNIRDKIKQIIETPLEGEIPKHDKVKIITIKLIEKESLEVLFYIKYKQINGYNKQIKKLYNTYSKLKFIPT